jgi:hypothetical protein
MSDAYQEGYNAFKEGSKLDENPHPTKTEQSRSWEEGWEDAKIEAGLQARSICADKNKPS